MHNASPDRAEPGNSKNQSTKMETPIAYQVITDRITTLLEQGTAPWRKPWASAQGFPKNLISRKEYTGINTWMLHSSGFSSAYWLTFKQAKELGGNVRKGEKGTPVVFTKQLPPRLVDVPNENGGTDKLIDGKKLGGRMLKYYTAFNLDQCEGIDIPDAGPRYDHDPIESAEAIIAGYHGPTIEHGGGRATYSPTLDRVCLPERHRFEIVAEYYSTAFHELAHSTGHPDRLHRFDKAAEFGSENYGKEELVAEMCAAYLCGKAGIENATLENSAAYLKGWLEAIKKDARLIITAASAAQKAANLILEAGK